MLMRGYFQPLLAFGNNRSIRREDAKALDISGGKAEHIHPKYQYRRQRG